MRVAIVSESFLPQVNGVSNTVRHILDRLVDTGHQALVIAPGPGLRDYRGVSVVRVPSVRVPGYRSFRLGLPVGEVEQALARFAPDVVHAASPVLMGAAGLRAAQRLGVPALAVYQTDLGGFARQYGVPAAAVLDGWVAHVHNQADRTLVPSASAWATLEAQGVSHLHWWRRGVDADLFHPRRRLDAVHDRWARASSRAAGSVVVGYVGRLAKEKEVRRLCEVARVPGTRLVVVGDGPERAWLEGRIPGAAFTGMLCGRELAQAFASLDVFVHTGTSETFCQTVQEAQASGVATIAPARGGPLDLVADGGTGLLYDPDDPGALRQAVEAVVVDPVLRARLGSGGLASVQGRSWAGAVDQLVAEHYTDLAGARVDARRAAPAA